MKAVDYDAIHAFIDAEIDSFYDKRLRSLTDLKLSKILRKNPYLFRAKNLLTPRDLIASLLDAQLSSSEEKQFGDVLERLAIFTSELTCNGRKSSARGIDLEFDDEGTRYVVAIKSGWNWGNSSQYQSLELNFRNALQIQRQANAKIHVQAVLGMCYGNRVDADRGLYIAKMGQSFWHFISGDMLFYETILTRIGLRADFHNRTFALERVTLQSRLETELFEKFCFPDGKIDWLKILHFNSGNDE